MYSVRFFSTSYLHVQIFFFLIRIAHIQMHKKISPQFCVSRWEKSYT